MTEHKAAQIANMVYKAAYAKQMTAKEAFKILDKLEPYMSGAQLIKYNDFSYAARHNPDFFA